MENNLRHIDLFAGIGGFRLALESLGCECVFSSEKDKFAQLTYKANFGDTPNGDITKIHVDEIPDHDILTAGFPCQPFSIAGVSVRNSLGKEHGFMDKVQGTLFFDIVRIIEHKRPKAFVLENVKNLVSHDKKRTFRTIIETLELLEYNVFYKILDAVHYVPQHRERIFIVGLDRRAFPDAVYNFPEIPDTKKPILKDILEPFPGDGYTLGEKTWAYLQKHKAMHREKNNGFGYHMPDPNGHSNTLTANYYKSGNSVLLEQVGKPPRMLTPRECARLQGYPDSFVIPVSKTQAYKQFGNSVAVPLVKDICKSLINLMRCP